MTAARTLQHRLADRVRESFVGRSGELSILLQVLEEEGPLVIHVHGVAGVGKSTLLAVFADEARARGATVLRLDGRSVEPTERGLLRALAETTAASEPDLDRISQRLTQMGPRVVLVLDTYEVLRLMDAWLRRELVPGLPEGARVVLAGRHSPVASWLISPEWHGLFRSVSLGPLRDRDALGLLGLAGVDDATAVRIQRFARGHPLALRLAAQAVQDAPETDLERMTLPRVLETLAGLYLSEVEDAGTRSVLEASCVLRRVTHSLVEAIEPTADSRVWDRLRSLPFVHSGPDGLFVHDAVREAIASSLRTADPARHRAVRRAAWKQLQDELRGAAREELWTYTADMLHLLENPVVRDAFFPSDAQQLYTEPARREDGAGIHEIIARHENPESAEILAGWWEWRPSAFHVVREGGGSVAGFYCMFDPEAVAPRTLEGDPVARCWWRHFRKTRGSRSDRVLFVRRWLSRDHGEAPSPVQAACWLDIKRSYMGMRPGLRRVYLGGYAFGAYVAVAARLRFRAVPELDVSLGGARYRTAMLDMGPSSVDGWLAELVSAELSPPRAGVVDFGSRELVVDGARVPLTKLEFGLLSYLIQNESRAVPRLELLQKVWGYEHGVASNVVDQVVKKLRKKLGAQSSRIEAVRGLGYRFREG